jgi:hypothetical protein
MAVQRAQDLSLEPGFDLHWQMTTCERFVFLGLLKQLQPKVSLEIGTYMGGSLQVLARYSEAVISVDIDPGVATRLAGKFPAVEFHTGDSGRLLPDLVRALNEQKRAVGFVLIDGSHTTAGVRRDIETLLELQPQQEMVFILHDSFNPACREGMRTANWAKSPFVHEVELDFVPGVYYHAAHDTAEAKTMWGGFACAVLRPEKRQGALIVQESQLHLHQAVKRRSSHNHWYRLRRRILP